MNSPKISIAEITKSIIEFLALADHRPGIRQFVSDDTEELKF